jgi:hypothetical protein
MNQNSTEKAKKMEPPTPVVQAQGHKFQVTDFTIHIPNSGRSIAGPEASPSRWRTREFMGYYIAFALVVPVMIWIPIRLSSGMYMTG